MVHKMSQKTTTLYYYKTIVTYYHITMKTTLTG